MDRITAIESKITDVLYGINATVQDSGYKYYSNTGTVHIYDEAQSLAINRTTSGSSVSDVNHLFEWNDTAGIENTNYDPCYDILTNKYSFTITSKVHNVLVVGQQPKNAIKVKMNELFSDMIYAFGVASNNRLSETVDSLKFVNTYREFEDITNNRIQSGSLITQWEIIYSQPLSNPDLLT